MPEGAARDEMSGPWPEFLITTINNSRGWARSSDSVTSSSRHAPSNLAARLFCPIGASTRFRRNTQSSSAETPLLHQQPNLGTGLSKLRDQRVNTEAIDL